MTQDDTDLQDVVDLAMSGGIAIVAFLVAAIIYKIADNLNMNPFDDQSGDGGFADLPEM
jgi:hypothetical protein